MALGLGIAVSRINIALVALLLLGPTPLRRCALYLSGWVLANGAALGTVVLIGSRFSWAMQLMLQLPDLAWLPLLGLGAGCALLSPENLVFYAKEGGMLLASAEQQAAPASFPSEPIQLTPLRPAAVDTRSFKRSLHHSERYNRRGFGLGEEVAGSLQTAYQSDLVGELRSNGYQLQQGRLTVRLAEAFGFCWGVERAVAMAYETRRHYPSERIWITNEIIHNPSVNDHLREMNVQFIPVDGGVKDFSDVASGDVVILPAFGATVQEMQLLNERGCHIVDTTCPWVSKVWNTVEKHKKHSFTSIIHGKVKHEETLATSSFAGTYLVVLDLAEAQLVCDYILAGAVGGGPTPDQRQAFMQRFERACSPGFDPDRDLLRVGVANQTTMLKSETEEIGKLFERTMLQRFGPAELNDHFLAFNTICDATQERQDAMFALVDEPLDLMVVIGGYNSSNTTHLQEIAVSRGIRSFHIDTPERIGPGNRIEHMPLGGELDVEDPFLPEGPIRVGITSGASTPDRIVEQVIQRLIDLTQP